MSTSYETTADDPPVAVDIALVTGDGAPADQILQREGSSLAAAPCAAPGIEAGPAALRRVDSVQPDALAMNLDGVGVNDGGDPGDVSLRTPGKTYDCSDEKGRKHASTGGCAASLGSRIAWDLHSPITKCRERTF